MIQCLRITVLGCSHAAHEAAAEHLGTNPSVTQMNGAPQWPLACAGTHFESPRQDRQAPSDWVVMTRSCLTSHMVLQTGSRETFVTQTLRVSFGDSGNIGLEACHTDFEVRPARLCFVEDFVLLVHVPCSSRTLGHTGPRNCPDTTTR